MNMEEAVSVLLPKLTVLSESDERGERVEQERVQQEIWAALKREEERVEQERVRQETRAREREEREAESNRMYQREDDQRNARRTFLRNAGVWCPSAALLRSEDAQTAKSRSRNHY
jgi:hypothetical protein